MRIFLFLFSLFLYLTTCAPDIYWGDNSETVIGYYFLGKYFIDLSFFSYYFGKIFTFIPIGNVPARVNFFSTFISSLNSVIFYNIVSFFLKNRENGNERVFLDEKLLRISAFLGSMFFLTSYTIWRFAVIGESTSFIFFCYLFLLYLFFEFGERDIRVLYFISFIFAFFLNFSTIMDFYFNFFVILFIYIFWVYSKYWKIILSFYIFGYIFFLIIYILKRINYDISFLFHYYLKLLSDYFSISITEVFKYSISLLYYLDKQIPYHLGIFSILGLFFIYKFKKYQIKLLFLIFFSPFLLMLFRKSLEDIFSYEHHFFTVYLLLFIFFGYTFYFIMKRFNFKIMYFIFFTFFSVNVIFNFQLNNKSSLKFARLELLKLLTKTDKDAIIITPNLELKKLINYFQLVENKRKDINVLGVVDFSNPIFLELIRKGGTFFDDTIPAKNFFKSSKNMNIFINSKDMPIYLLIARSSIDLEGKFLYNQFQNYNKKIIITVSEFRGEKIPSPCVYNLVKVEK